MNLTIAAVGRLKSGPERDLWDQYATRLSWNLTLREVEERKPLKGKELMEREAELLLQAVPDGAHLVAVDRAGKSISSEDLAGRFADWMATGPQEIAFVIGGADGLHQSVLARADSKLSMGALTWPHMLARCMLLEQVFRAQCILTNHPYHR